MDDGDLSDEDLDALALPEEAYLRIRVLRDNTLDVVYGGLPLPVTEIDIDDMTLERLRKRPSTARSRS